MIEYSYGRQRASAPMTNPVDAHIGAKLRERRQALRLSQNELGQMVGIAGQQIQKYECGENRISISRMWELARALKLPMTFFYQGLESAAPAALPTRGDLGKDREAREFVRNYYAMPGAQRKQFLNMLNAVANTAGKGPDRTRGSYPA